MIRYVKYQNQNQASNAYGKWYLRAVCDETVELDQLAAHMAAHNSAYSKGTIQGILTDAVSCIKELMLEGKSVKLPDLAIFKIGLISNGADTRENAKTSLVTGFRFNAKGTGEMAIASLKQEIQLKELKYYSGGETDDENEPGNEPSNEPGNNPGGGTTPGNSGDNNEPPSLT